MFKMSPVLFVLLSLLLGASISAQESHASMPASAQINSAAQLARCRAHCIDAFSHRLTKGDSEARGLTNGQCMADSDCWMCWDYCEMFQTNFEQWGGMCSQKTLCFEGCRLACFVYNSASDSDEPYHRDLWSFPSTPTLESDAIAGWLRLRWPNVVPLTAAVPPLPHVLYVVFWHSDFAQPWLQLAQTVSTSYETRHGDIVVGGNQAEFLVLAVTRDGIVAIGRPYKETTTTSGVSALVTTAASAMVSPTDDPNEKAKIHFILAIVGASVFAGLLCSIGLVFLYRMIQAQRRRQILCRTNAIRFRPQSRHRYTSASSRAALITGLNVAKLEPTATGQQQPLEPRPVVDPMSTRYTSVPDRHRFSELFKGTIFESPPPYDEVQAISNKRSRFSFSKGTQIQASVVSLSV